MRSKVLLAATTALPLFFSGCLADVLMSAGIVGELNRQQASTLVDTLNSVKETKSELEVNQAIRAYHAEKGVYPQSLQDLVPDYFSSVPVKPDGTPWGYDPTTGTLLSAPVPVVASAPAAESNAQKMARIREAINKFGMATGYYPGTLQQLVPYYLPELPKAANGVDFLYDPQTGALYEPPTVALNAPAPQQQPQPRRPAAAGGGGVGPMGEVMTGISIQNELNSMSSAGSAAAGSSARHNARQLGQSQTDRQTRAMDELGL